MNVNGLIHGNAPLGCQCKHHTARTILLAAVLGVTNVLYFINTYFINIKHGIVNTSDEEQSRKKLWKHSQ